MYDLYFYRSNIDSSTKPGLSAFVYDSVDFTFMSCGKLHSEFISIDGFISAFDKPSWILIFSPGNYGLIEPSMISLSVCVCVFVCASVNIDIWTNSSETVCLINLKFCSFLENRLTS